MVPLYTDEISFSAGVFHVVPASLCFLELSHLSPRFVPQIQILVLLIYDNSLPAESFNFEF